MCNIEKVGFSCKIDGNFALADAVALRVTKGLFGFFFFCSSLITPHSIFVTHHSLLKILKFPNPTRLAHFTQLLITHTSLIFVGPIPVTWLDRSY